MIFVPLWLTFSYTVVAFSLWGGRFLFQWGVMDYSGGYVIHLSSGIAGFNAAFWVGPRSKKDRERFQPNNVLLTLAGAGLLWLGWAGFNGGVPYVANIDSSMAVLNTNVCAATSLLVWTWLDVIFFNKPSVSGAVQEIQRTIGDASKDSRTFAQLHTLVVVRLDRKELRQTAIQ